MKLRRVAALVSAAVLALSMGMTSFASDSVDVEAILGVEELPKDVSLEQSPVSEAVDAFFGNADSVKDVLNKAMPDVNIGENDVVKVIGKADYTLVRKNPNVEGGTEEVSFKEAGLTEADRLAVRVEIDEAEYIGSVTAAANGLTETVDLSLPTGDDLQAYMDKIASGDYSEAVYAYMMHETAENEWEVIKAPLVYDYIAGKWFAEAELEHFSPIGILQVLPSAQAYFVRNNYSLDGYDQVQADVTNSTVTFKIDETTGAVSDLEVVENGGNTPKPDDKPGINDKPNTDNGNTNTPGNNGNKPADKPATTNKPATSTASTANKSPKTGE